MSAISNENILDFVRDLNALIGVHQHPVDQQLGQLCGQRVHIENCLGHFLAAVLSHLFILLLCLQLLHPFVYQHFGIVIRPPAVVHADIGAPQLSAISLK